MSNVHDPFDQLSAFASIDEPIDEAFATRLRGRVQRALDLAAGRPATRFDLGGVPRASTTPTTPAIATALPTADAVLPATEPSNDINERNSTMAQVITPYICVHDANAAIEWYKEYFRAEVSNVIPWEGRVGHAEVNVSGAVFYLSDEAPALGVIAPERDGSRSAVSIVLLVAAVEEFVERATRGGAVVQRPIEEAHGSRSAWLVDPFGHRWNVGTPVYDEAAAASRRSPSEPYYMTLSSPDVERSAAFYGAVLDWEFSPPNPSGGRHVVNTTMPIGLRPTADEFATTEPGEIVMWFTARDFDAALDRVSAAGGTVVERNNWDSGREAICEDDQGVAFKLSEPAPGYDK